MKGIQPTGPNNAVVRAPVAIRVVTGDTCKQRNRAG
jgi:hypothetical protein